MKTRLFVLAGATAALLVAAGGIALASNGADDRPIGAATLVAPAPAGSPTTAASPTPAASPTTVAPAPAPTLDRAAAERIALDHVGGGRITDGTELEWEHGAQVWEVEVNHTRDLHVDAASGAVTRDRLDD
ncbi:PepSY domain-containing protein [Pseudonocardia xishanensis]|uniref:PepSY domain-containing protein n=1 Tax=Pseudonocardia xishanensis TaxID=630995 RepID=A0ABP8RKI1_9PSEU